MSLILLHNVSVRFADTKGVVLRDVFFGVNAGERVGLIGKNGAGPAALGLRRRLAPTAQLHRSEACWLP